MTVITRRSALLAATLAWGLCVPAHAVLMEATVTGTIGSGFDAYRNSVYFGTDGGYNLNGMAATVSIVYESDRFGPNQYGGNTYRFEHSPAYPSFLGTVGAGPIVLTRFTVNGVTLAGDASGSGERGMVYVENPPDSGPYGQPDSWTLTGGDSRSTWCPNDGQCSETVQLSASQTYASSDLFGGQRPFSPADSFSAQPAPYRSIGAYVRLYQSNACPAGVCPEGRFADNGIHWVEFVVNGSSLTVAPAVPEPGTWALWLAGGVMLCTWRRRRHPGRGVVAVA